MQDQLIDQYVERLAQALLSKNSKVATAESCTGGGISAAMTDLAGSSDWFDRGFVTYSNAAKQSMLGVTEDALTNHGAVSELVVMQMAQGAVANSEADIAVAVSGIAGPDGGTEDKPVGTVWIGWCERDGRPTAQLFQFSGDRNAVRQATIVQALEGLLNILDP